MSTRSSIGYTDEYHLYKDVCDDWIWLISSEGQIIRLMPADVWDEMQGQIVASFLKAVQLGYAELREVWGKDSPAKIDRKTLIENLANLLEGVEN